MTRVGLLGGEPYERDLLRQWLGTLPGVRSITGLVGPGRGARGPQAPADIDVIVSVVDEHDEDPACAWLRLLEGRRGRTVVAVLRNPSDRLIRRVVMAGANAVVAVASGPGTLHAAVTAASRGGAWLDPSLSAFVLGHLGRRAEHDNDLGLTPKEYEVGLLFPRGLTNREIAAELGISEETVKSHVRSIYAKLGVSSRSTAAAIITASTVGVS